MSWYGFPAESGAEFSADRGHRFTLWRIWSPPPGKLLGFVMLNPSTANETKDDPTTTRNMARARLLGYAGIVQANVYSFRTKYPGILRTLGYPGGPNVYENRQAILGVSALCDDIVCAWGTHPLEDDARAALAIIRSGPSPFPPRRRRVFHLGFLRMKGPGGRRYRYVNSDVLVRHPLMTPYGDAPNYGLQEWT